MKLSRHGQKLLLFFWNYSSPTIIEDCVFPKFKFLAYGLDHGSRELRVSAEDLSGRAG